MTRARSAQPFAPATGTFLAAAAVWLLVLGTGSTEAAWGHGHHHRGHHHRGHPHPLHVPRGFLGVLPGPTPLDPSDAAKVARTKIRTVRIPLQWYRAQQHRGPFAWTTGDVMIARLAANGIAVAPTLGGTPSWVAGMGTVAPVKNHAAKRAWQTFVTAAVRRYGPGGTFWTPSGLDGTSPFHARCGCNASPIPIRTWQIWNEPNLKQYFRPKPAPREYAKLVKLSRSAIDRADGNARVVLAGLSTGSGKRTDIKAVPYLRRLYRVPGIKRSFDAAAIHPYSRSIEDMRTAISRFHKAMKKKHDRRTPLWITELGWGSGHPNRFGHNKGLRGQRRMLQRSLKLVLHKRKAWRVEHVFWFFWRDPPKTAAHMACSFCTSAGLLRNDGRPKPAYKAYKRLAKRAH